MTMTENDRCYEEAKRVAADLENTVDRICRLRELNERGDNAADQLEEELQERPLCADTEITVRVTLGTGGPASGVDFTENGARVWFQDWGTPRVYADLDRHTQDYLKETWYIGYDDNGEELW
jgi:hypothetical protein